MKLILDKVNDADENQWLQEQGEKNELIVINNLPPLNIDNRQKIFDALNSLTFKKITLIQTTQPTTLHFLAALECFKNPITDIVLDEDLKPNAKQISKIIPRQKPWFSASENVVRPVTTKDTVINLKAKKPRQPKPKRAADDTYSSAFWNKQHRAAEETAITKLPKLQSHLIPKNPYKLPSFSSIVQELQFPLSPVLKQQNTSTSFSNSTEEADKVNSTNAQKEIFKFK